MAEEDDNDVQENDRGMVVAVRGDGNSGGGKALERTGLREECTSEREKGREREPPTESPTKASPLVRSLGSTQIDAHEVDVLTFPVARPPSSPRPPKRIPSSPPCPRGRHTCLGLLPARVSRYSASPGLPASSPPCSFSPPRSGLRALPSRGQAKNQNTPAKSAGESRHRRIDWSVCQVHTDQYTKSRTEHAVGTQRANIGAEIT